LPENPRENLFSTLNHESPWWLPCPQFDESIAVVGDLLRERTEAGLDDWGVGWKVKNNRSSSFPVHHPITSPDIVDEHPFPEVSGSSFSSAIETAGKVDRREIAIFGSNGWGLFERAWLLLGMTRFFRWTIRHPDALRSLISRIAEVKLALTEGLVDQVGVDIVGYGDDWGMEAGMLIPLRTWRDLIKPWQRRLYRAAKAGGARVYQHSDGKVEEVIPDLVEIGIDILNIQRECNDWPSILSEHGRSVCLWGGVSARTLDLGGEDEIENEVREACRLGRDGGVVMAQGHSLKYSEEKIEVMRRAWDRWGRYGND
jgi:uroporphyrinogen decarboxylase